MSISVPSNNQSQPKLTYIALQEQTCEQPEQFKREVADIFSQLEAAQRKAAWDGTSFSSSSEALSTVLESVRNHGVTLPGHICAVVVTTLVLEGWSNRLDPHHSVLDQVQAMLHPSSTAGKLRHAANRTLALVS